MPLTIMCPLRCWQEAPLASSLVALKSRRVKASPSKWHAGLTAAVLLAVDTRFCCCIGLRPAAALSGQGNGAAAALV